MNRPLRIAFFGSSEFALPSLKRLLESNYTIVQVVTQPDRPKGRHLKLSAPPVKEYALEKGLRVLQPLTLSQDFIASLKVLKADLFVTVAYGHILKKEILEIPKIFAINVHASLLPKYRGAAPVNWTIINGDTQTGVTIIRMNERMDEGDIILQKKIEIKSEETADSLEKKLAQLGADILMEVLALIEKGKINFIKQDKRKSSIAPKLKKKDGLLDWNAGACEIHNRVRGLIPWPGAYTYWHKRILKIWETEAFAERIKGKPGTVLEVSKDFIKISTGEGILAIKELQLEGKKRMHAREFLAGHETRVGEIFG